MSTTATFTELLRRPNDVTAQTESGAVRLTRRDAEDLILIRAGDLARQHQGIALASRLMHAALRHQGRVGDAVADVFGWATALGEDERVAFAAEVEQLIWSAAELGEYARLLQTVQSWQGTAEAYLAGMTPPAADEWFDDLPAVERP